MSWLDDIDSVWDAPINWGPRAVIHRFTIGGLMALVALFALLFAAANWVRWETEKNTPRSYHHQQQWQPSNAKHPR